MTHLLETTTKRIGLAAILVLAVLVFSATEVSAVQPRCPDDFFLASAAVYPNADLNDDGLICVRKTPAGHATIDNLH